MVSLLNMNRKRNATEPRDKAYALYGVLRSLEVGLERPDHLKPIEDVYTEFTLDVMGWIMSPYLLIEAGESTLENSPSWIPDWRNTLQQPHGSWKVADSSKPNFKVGHDHRSITTDSFMADTVVSVFFRNLVTKDQHSEAPDSREENNSLLQVSST
jgi:hypothetical protein